MVDKQWVTPNMRTILLVVLFVAATAAMEPPSIFKICKKSDPNVDECVANAAKDAIVAMANGLESFKILPLEPLKIPGIKIGESKGSISLKQEYKNIELHGLTRGLVLKSHSYDWDNLIFNATFRNPQINFVADYSFDGKILMLPIKSAGKANITMYDTDSYSQIEFVKYEKEGESYLKAKKFSCIWDPNNINFYFDDLMRSDNPIGVQMTTFLKENSLSIFKELKSAYEVSFSVVFKQITNNIFSRIPMNKLFPLN